MPLHIHRNRDEALHYQRLGRLVTDASDFSGLALLLRSYLDLRPMAFDGRCLLRRLQIDAYDEAESILTPLKEQWNRLKLPALLSQANEKIETEPQKAIQLAEDILTINPYDEQGNMIIVKAAKKLGAPKLAVMALETICRRKPKNTRLLNELAQAYMSGTDFREAASVYEEVLSLKPGDTDASNGLQRATQGASTQPADTGASRAPYGTMKLGEAPAKPPTYEPREMVYSVMPLLNPLKDDVDPIRGLCTVLEPIEDHAPIQPDVIGEWFQWIETELGPTRHEVEAEFAQHPDDPALAIRLGFLRAGFLELPEARDAFSIAALDETYGVLGYKGMTCCLMHEAVLVRAAE